MSSTPPNPESTKSTGRRRQVRQVRQVRNDSEDDDYDQPDEHLLVINSDPMSKRDQPTVTVKVNNHSMRFLVDSGAFINVIDE